MFDMRHLVDDELTDPNANNDSSSDSLDYDDPDASAAFLAAPQNMQYANDDSFSSEGSSDSMDGGGGGMQQFAVEDDGDAFDDEDSYDDPRYNTSPGRDRDYVDSRDRDPGYVYDRREPPGRMPPPRSPPPPYGRLPAYGRDDRRYSVPPRG